MWTTQGHRARAMQVFAICSLRGQSCLPTMHCKYTGRKACTIPSTKRHAKKQTKARALRRHSARERLARDQRQAPQAAEALHQALEEVHLPATVRAESEGHVRSSAF
jgi:hypothetical protein